MSSGPDYLANQIWKHLEPKLNSVTTAAVEVEKLTENVEKLTTHVEKLTTQLEELTKKVDLLLPERGVEWGDISICEPTVELELHEKMAEFAV